MSCYSTFWPNPSKDQGPKSPAAMDEGLSQAPGISAASWAQESGLQRRASQESPPSLSRRQGAGEGGGQGEGKSRGGREAERKAKRGPPSLSFLVRRRTRDAKEDEAAGTL